MIPTQWSTSNDIHNMFQFSKATERKMRLFAIACYKHAIKPENHKPELKLAESYVDGIIHRDVLHNEYTRLNHAWLRGKPEFCLVFSVVNLDRMIKIVSHGTKVMSRMTKNRQMERRWQVKLLRHMVKPL
jgi:hypothetical protein